MNAIGPVCSSGNDVFSDIPLGDDTKKAVYEPLLGESREGIITQDSSCYSTPGFFKSALATAAIGGVILLTAYFTGSSSTSSGSQYLRGSNSPSIVQTSAASIQELNQINDTPYDLELTASSAWGTGMSCWAEGAVASCASVLHPGDRQIISMTDEASGSSGLGLDYNLYRGTKYSGHIHINYGVNNGAISSSLTNNAEGTIQLVQDNDNLYIKEALTPSQAPVTSPPTISFSPSLKPTSAVPSLRPSPAPPSTSRPSSLNGNVETSAWYLDWTSWFTGPPYNIPTGVNLLNVFVGELMYDLNGNPTLGGFGNLNLEQLDAFTSYCKEQSPPIDVKVSVGGGGGSYDNTWDILTSENTQAFAQGLADFCHLHGLVGVDFDYEELKSASQEVLVGTLMKQFKELDPNLQATLCTNAGFDTWKGGVKTVLDAAISTPGKCPLDRLYVMSYYNSLEEEQGWVNSWANWLKTDYNCNSEVTTVGVDTFDANAYNATEFANWALDMDYSVGHWAFDPNRPAPQW